MITPEFATCPDCGEIAEIRDHFVLPSTDGPVEHVQVLCIHRHCFTLPAATLARLAAVGSLAPEVSPDDGLGRVA